ncbi:MAG: hypothetical protein IJS08_01045 [Victivallales bacterium]|nr:hypothetical protein [Victivallales bacterium]
MRPFLVSGFLSGLWTVDCASALPDTLQSNVPKVELSSMIADVKETTYPLLVVPAE